MIYGVKPPAKLLWTGRVISTLTVLFMAFDGIAKVLRVPQVIEATAKIGFPVDAIVPLGAVLLFCTLLYSIRPTALLGAVLLTGYLGGAVATHVHIGTAWGFPMIMGILVWAGLLLRDPYLIPVFLGRRPSSTF